MNASLFHTNDARDSVDRVFSATFWCLHAARLIRLRHRMFSSITNLQSRLGRFHDDCVCERINACLQLACADEVHDPRFCVCGVLAQHLANKPGCIPKTYQHVNFASHLLLVAIMDSRITGCSRGIHTRVMLQYSAHNIMLTANARAHNHYKAFAQ